MNKRLYLYAVLPAVLFAGTSRADLPAHEYRCRQSH